MPTHYIANTRFVVATGTWDASDTTVWSTSSGGSAGASAPTTSNAVLADSNSGTRTVTIASGATCGAFSVGASASAVTFAVNSTLTATGTFNINASNSVVFTGSGTISCVNISWSATADWSGFTGTVQLAATTTVATFWIAGSFPATLEINGSGSSYQVGTGQSWNITAAGTLKVTLGGWDAAANGDTSNSVGHLSSSGTGVRAITLGAGTLTLSGTGVVWDTSTTTNLTFSAASSTIVISTSAGATTFAGGGLTYGNLTISGADAVNSRTFTGANTWATFTSGANKLVFSDAQTATAFVLTGCKSITGNLVQASGTVTAPAGCVITNSNASGGAMFDATAATNGGGNSGAWNFGGQSTAVSDGKSF